MKKNIYLIIITIITVVCIIAGSLYHIGGFALGLFDNLIPRSDKSLGNVCTEELSVAPAIPSQYPKAKEPTTEETPRVKSLLPFLRAQH